MADGGEKGGARRDVDLCGKGHMTLIPVCAVCTSVGGATVTPISNLQFPYRVMVRRVFVCGITNPGGSKYITTTISDGTVTATVTSDADTKTASTTSGTAILEKNTNISIAVAVTSGGTGSVTNVIVCFEQMDEFNDPG